MGNEEKNTPEAKSRGLWDRGSEVSERFMHRHTCTQMHTNTDMAARTGGREKGKSGGR